MPSSSQGLTWEQLLSKRWQPWPHWSSICYLCKYVGLSVPYWGNNWEQGTPEPCGLRVCGCACAATGTGSVPRPHQDRAGKVRRAQEGRKSRESQSLSPQALAKIQRHSLPSFADVVETMGDLTLGQLRSPSAYSLRVQAALRNAFVLCF